MRKSVFPTVDPEELKFPPFDGDVFLTPSFCREKAEKSKCLKFYRDLALEPAFHICPYGFTACVYRTSTGHQIATGLKVEGHFDRKKLKHRLAQDFVPSITEEEFARLNQVSIALQDEQRRVESEISGLRQSKEFLQNVFHEIRKLNRDLKAQAEELNRAIDQIPPSGNAGFQKYRIQNVYATSSLVSIRLDSYDLLSNPLGVTAANPLSVAVYKKFEKVKHCLDNKARQSRVNFLFEGNSYKEIPAYDVFELLPYVLFENALKYSPEQQDVHVKFERHGNYECIQISNVGPRVYQDELEAIFQRDQRGRLAIQNFSGTGIGLFFAKQVCDIHSVDITVSSDSHVLFNLNGIPYSNFSVTLTLP